MGREIKRVPLDFDWPVGKIWPGYLISLCSINKRDCDQCRHFARLLDLPITYGCPELISLDVPSGDGYQLWETVTEGSSMSPVFETPDKLARWLSNNKISAFADSALSYETWLKFIQDEREAFSATIKNGKMKSGVEAVVESNERRKE